MSYVVFNGGRIYFQRLNRCIFKCRHSTSCIGSASAQALHRQQRTLMTHSLLARPRLQPPPPPTATAAVRWLRSSSAHWSDVRRGGPAEADGFAPTAKSPQSPQPAPADSSAADSSPADSSPADSSPAVRAEPKKSLASRVWHEVLHYWNGLKLLALETRIALRISLKYMRGATISRRERRHLVRTVADLFRMVPFLFFIVIPFMEFLLPFYLKFMPFMLPSTFTEKDKEAEKLRIRLKAKLETAKFLQETLYEGFQAKGKASREGLADFRQFMQKCTTASRYATTDELLRFSALFADELTLDNLERPQLAAICKLLDMAAVGSKAMILLQLELRLRQLHTDDLMIREEGIDRLTVSELQAACRARGIPSLGVSEEQLRHQLVQWLDLHLVHSVPASLLLLSRSLHFPDSVDAEDRLRKAIGSLPEQAVRSAEASSAGADSRTRLEALKGRDRAIRSEEKAEKAAAKAKEDLADDLEAPSMSAEPRDAAATAKAEDLDIGAADLQELETAIDEVSAKALDEEEIRELREELSEYLSGLAVAPVVGGNRRKLSNEEERAAKLLSAKVDNLLQEMDGMFDKVYSEKEALERRLHKAQRAQAAMSDGLGEAAASERQLARQIERQREQVLSMNDILLALRRLQKMPDNDKWERILQVLDEDKDGKIEVQHVTKVIELLGSENLRLSSGDLVKLLETLDKEKLLSLRVREPQAGGGSSGRQTNVR